MLKFGWLILTMSKNIIKFSKIFILLLFLMMMHENCQKEDEDIPILSGASNVNIKTHDTYYKRYLSYSDIKEEIKNIEKNMKGWEKTNITGCDFKYFLFQKMQNSEIKSYLMYNMTWKKGKCFSQFHIEKELCNNKPKLNIIHILYEDENTEIGATNFLADQIEFTAKTDMKDLELIKCYAGDFFSVASNSNVTEYFRWKHNIKCSDRLDNKDIEKVVLEKTHINGNYFLYVYINKQKMQIFKDDDPSAFLFLLNKDHILADVKVKDIKIENNRIELDTHNKNISAAFVSHFFYSYACCHEIEIPSTEINKIK